MQHFRFTDPEIGLQLRPVADTDTMITYQQEQNFEKEKQVKLTNQPHVT